MVAPLERALKDLDDLIAVPAPFDPKTSTRTFYLATNDYVELTLLPTLLAQVWNAAPHVDVRVATLAGDVYELLAMGELDLGIGVFGQLGEPTPPRGVRLRRVITDGFTCVVREGHPHVGNRLRLEDFLVRSHALVAPRGGAGSIVDTALAAVGKKRRIALQVPHFLVAPHIVRQTDLVLTLPSRVAQSLGPLLGLRQLTPPIELGTFSMSMAWHERQHADPALTWLRGLVVAFGTNGAQRANSR
jgi:DNA-binding transcriptional LysR family regulator